MIFGRSSLRKFAITLSRLDAASDLFSGDSRYWVSVFFVGVVGPVEPAKAIANT